MTYYWWLKTIRQHLSRKYEARKGRNNAIANILISKVELSELLEINSDGELQEFCSRMKRDGLPVNDAGSSLSFDVSFLGS